MDTKYHTTRFTFDKGRDKVWKAIAADLQRFIPRDAVVLDLGCGYGDFISNVIAKEKHALDVNPEMQQFLNPGITFYNSSATGTGKLGKGHFDVVFASNLFEHLSHDELATTLKGIKAILKKEGILLLIQPNYRYAPAEYFDDYTHKTIFTHVSIADFLKSKGFSIVHVKPRYLPFSMKSTLPKSRLLTSIYLKLPYKPFAKQMLVIARK